MEIQSRNSRAFSKYGDLYIHVVYNLNSLQTEIHHYKENKLDKIVNIENSDSFTFTVRIFNGLVYTIARKHDVFPEGVKTLHSNFTLSVFNFEGKLVQKFPLDPLSAPDHSYRMLAVSPQCVVIMNDHYCTVYSLSGKRLHQWEIKIHASFTHLAVERNSIYATDLAHKMIYVFSYQGRLERRFGWTTPQHNLRLPGGFACALFVKDNFVVVSYESGFQMFHVEGTYKDVYPRYMYFNRTKTDTQVARDVFMDGAFLCTFDFRELTVHFWRMKLEIF